MTIFNNDKVTQYLVTDDGQFMEFTETKTETVLKSTSHVQVFLSWMVGETVKEEQIRENIENSTEKLKLIKEHWRMQKRGHFNSELYNKVLEAKNKK